MHLLATKPRELRLTLGMISKAIGYSSKSKGAISRAIQHLIHCRILKKDKDHGYLSGEKAEKYLLWWGVATQEDKLIMRPSERIANDEAFRTG